MLQPKKEFCQNSKVGSQESGLKISTILSKIRAPRPLAKVKISYFPSEFHVTPKYMKKTSKSDFQLVILVHPIG